MAEYMMGSWTATVLLLLALGGAHTDWGMIMGVRGQTGHPGRPYPPAYTPAGPGPGPAYPPTYTPGPHPGRSYPPGRTPAPHPGRPFPSAYTRYPRNDGLQGRPRLTPTPPPPPATQTSAGLSGAERAQEGVSLALGRLAEAARTATETVRQAVSSERRVMEGQPGTPGPAGQPGRPAGPPQGQSSFRAVATFLGSSVAANRLAMPARTQLATLRILQATLNLTRGDIETLSRSRTTALLPNQMVVRSDTDFGSIPETFDTCPFPADSDMESRRNCWRMRNSRFRTIDGTCNNLQRPIQGRSLTPLVRFLQPDYADGIGSPRRGMSGRPLPSAREVSIRLFVQRTAAVSRVHTHFLMTTGQFLDHDLTRTAVFTLSSGPPDDVLSDVTCGADGCSTDGVENAACLPISIPSIDQDFSGRRCLMFVRTQAVTRRDCELGPRQQLDQLTHYIDGSNIYGSTFAESRRLREAGGSGLLATTPNLDRTLKPLLPQVTPEDNPDCRDINETIECFRAGDERVNENVALTGIHSIMVRVHNDIVAKLRRINPRWRGERLYQETRRIVGALWQHIIYNEYLPIILGPDLIRRYGLQLQRVGFSRAYNPEVSSEVTNVFATAAFRFSHSMVADTLNFNNQRFNDVESVRFSTIMRRPFEVYNNQRPGGAGIDSITLGLLSQRAPNIDRFFTPELTVRLFSENPPGAPGTDLASLNLQRGRDHGIPGYNAWRKWCGLSVARSFNDLRDITDREARKVLRTLYRRVDDVDLFAGAMSERRIPGTMIGPTFGCILARQFRRSRFGDRFFYDNRAQSGSFTRAQLQEIRKITLARLVCNSLDRVSTIQKFVMLQPLSEVIRNNGRRSLRDLYTLSRFYRNGANERRPCRLLPDIDLRKWRSYH